MGVWIVGHQIAYSEAHSSRVQCVSDVVDVCSDVVIHL